MRSRSTSPSICRTKRRKPRPSARSFPVVSRAKGDHLLAERALARHPTRTAADVREADRVVAGLLELNARKAVSLTQPRVQWALAVYMAVWACAVVGCLALAGAFLLRGGFTARSAGAALRERAWRRCVALPGALARGRRVAAGGGRVRGGRAGARRAEGRTDVPGPSRPANAAAVRARRRRRVGHPPSVAFAAGPPLGHVDRPALTRLAARDIGPYNARATWFCRRAPGSVLTKSSVPSAPEGWARSTRRATPGSIGPSRSRSCPRRSPPTPSSAIASIARRGRSPASIIRTSASSTTSGREAGVDYLVMQFLDGETLADRLARGPLPVAQAVEYAAQMAAALDRAHRAGIVHRDLKPGNVMLTRAGTGSSAAVKLLDFGLPSRRSSSRARAAGADDGDAADGPGDDHRHAPVHGAGAARGARRRRAHRPLRARRDPLRDAHRHDGPSRRRARRA